jgi:hypothetical protein
MIPWLALVYSTLHIVPVGAIVGPAHLVQEKAAGRGIDSVWLLNNHEDLDTDWTVYYLDYSVIRMCS